MDLHEAKQVVIKAGRQLSGEGLIPRTWGNLSCKTDENHFVISANGQLFDQLDESRVIELSMDDLHYEGDIKPSTEKKLHREVYRLRENAGFIIHTHQHNASAVAAMGKKVIKLDRDYEGIGDFVVCAEYGLPNTTKVTDKVVEAVKESVGNAIIMSNHGAVCFGKDYEEAYKVVHNLEEACGKYLEFMGVEPWIGDDDRYQKQWNDSPVIMKYIEHRNELQAYIDDFAQVVGPTLEVLNSSTPEIEAAAKAEGRPLLVRGKGAMCNDAGHTDAMAVSMIIEKNARAALAGIGYKPIGRYESKYMRQSFMQKNQKHRDD